MSAPALTWLFVVTLLVAVAEAVIIKWQADIIRAYRARRPLADRYRREGWT